MRSPKMSVRLEKPQQLQVGLLSKSAVAASKLAGNVVIGSLSDVRVCLWSVSVLECGC